jgi:hypothetical protein
MSMGLDVCRAVLGNVPDQCTRDGTYASILSIASTPLRLGSLRGRLGSAH